MTTIHPNDPTLQSFIPVRPGSHFPIQNLPYGVFSTGADPLPRVGVAIGDDILDLAAVAGLGLLPCVPPGVFHASSLNQFIALGRDTWQATRQWISELLRKDNPALQSDPCVRDSVLVPMADATLHLPVDIPGYTDFYSSREHATNCGTMFRDPANALLPNWLEMPIAYNGRASSVVVSGTPVQRPNGQLKLPDVPRPVFGPCRKLDFELETAFIVGQPSALGNSIAVDDAERHIFGMVLLNDWSARDIQQWEYMPLGPFNSKTFASSISPWIVTMEALEPFRVQSPTQEPMPLPYLGKAGKDSYDIMLEVNLRPAAATHATTICRTSSRFMYWSMRQQLAHHTVSGCNVRVGDLMGSGTISGRSADSLGCLLELTRNGNNPLTLSTGEQRRFLEDGDTVSMTGWCQADGYRIGFGDVSATVLPAQPSRAS
ncbi:fumarylacetoacetase [Cupriavidus sp. L7L]|uniref:fumarylacetoacetase n=1 Tax=Cupriavidus sp. L7L TaxID=2546443 RepID=UPI0010552FAC|nr:fumarylacetoacetase [Cupriavidus sp. L7L]TDF64520.1 fumarylacetoacetase [Cupriavidus sp. L7L]